MLRRFALTALVLLCLVVLATASAEAREPILKLVPDSALGVVVVNHLSAIEGKFQDLGKRMQLPVTNLLTVPARLANIGGPGDGKGGHY
jgi:hypothetical protein